MRGALRTLICAALLICLLLNAGCIRMTFGRPDEPTAAPQETEVPTEAPSAAPTQADRGMLTFKNDSDLDLTALYISAEEGHDIEPAAVYIAQGDILRLRFRDFGGRPGGEFFIDVCAITEALYYMEYARALEDGDLLRFCADEGSPSGYCFKITGRDGRTDTIPATLLHTQGGGAVIGS